MFKKSIDKWSLRPYAKVAVNLFEKMEHLSQPGSALVKRTSASKNQLSSSTANQGFPLCLVCFCNLYQLVADFFLRILRLNLERW
jgi:hypothetical protein